MALFCTAIKRDSVSFLKNLFSKPYQRLLVCSLACLSLWISVQCFFFLSVSVFKFLLVFCLIWRSLFLFLASVISHSSLFLIYLAIPRMVHLCIYATSKSGESSVYFYFLTHRKCLCHLPIVRPLCIVIYSLVLWSFEFFPSLFSELSWFRFCFGLVWFGLVSDRFGLVSVRFVLVWFRFGLLLFGFGLVLFGFGLILVRFRFGLVWFRFGLFSLFIGISTIVGHLMPKPFSVKNSCGTIYPIARRIRGFIPFLRVFARKWT